MQQALRGRGSRLVLGTLAVRPKCLGLLGLQLVIAFRYVLLSTVGSAHEFMVGFDFISRHSHFVVTLFRYTLTGATLEPVLA